MNRKDPPTSPCGFSEGPSDKGSERQKLGSRSQSFQGLAREDLAASTPTVRTVDRIGIDDPAIAVPADADRATHARLVLDVEDVGVAVVQENTRFTILLLLHETEHLGERCLHFLWNAEFGHDGTIYRGPPQFVVAQCLFCDWVFDFAVVGEEPRPEVVAQVTDLDIGVAADILNKLFFGHKLLGIIYKNGGLF